MILLLIMRSKDERDTIFSRIFELPNNKNKYKEYYSDNPDKEKIDNELRDHGNGIYSDEIYEQSLVDGIFSLLANLRQFSGQGSETKLTAIKDFDPSVLTSKLIRTATSYGAVSVGIIPTDKEFCYTIRGRGRHYGKVYEQLPWTLVFAVEMAEEEISKAPATDQSVEVVKGYLNAATVGLVLRSVLTKLGYNTEVHMDGESNIILPAAAAAAGLGGIGLHGLLVTKEWGPRVRLGAITTDAPLEKSIIKPFHIEKYCKTCEKCAKACPAKAIPQFTDMEKGVNHEACFSKWGEFGTDCGLCLDACPYSHGLGSRS